MKWARVATVFGLAVASATGQGRILRVPGDYAFIQPAIDAARDGDVVRCDHKLYVGARLLIQGKAIHLIAPSRIDLLLGHVTIRQVPAGRTLSVRGFKMQRMFIDNCPGTVLIDECETSLHALGKIAALEIHRSRQVLVERSRLTGVPPLQVDESTVSITDSEILGQSSWFQAHYGWAVSSPAISSTNSVGTLSRTLLRGGYSWPQSLRAAQPALEMFGGRWTITGVEQTRLSAGVKPGQAVPVFAGQGDIELDPRVSLHPSGNASPAVGVRLIKRAIPSLSANRVANGVVVELATEPWRAYAITVGLPGPRVPVGALGELWHSTSAFAVVTAGSVGATGQWVGRYPLASPIGLFPQPVVWQAVVGTRAGAIRLSNPDAFLVW